MGQPPFDSRLTQLTPLFDLVLAPAVPGRESGHDGCVNLVEETWHGRRASLLKPVVLVDGNREIGDSEGGDKLEYAEGD
jgi:hypothetical protein